MTTVDALREKLRNIIAQGQGRERCSFIGSRPGWWPEEIPFRNPANMRKEELEFSYKSASIPAPPPDIPTHPHGASRIPPPLPLQNPTSRIPPPPPYPAIRIPAPPPQICCSNPLFNYPLQLLSSLYPKPIVFFIFECIL